MLENSIFIIIGIINIIPIIVFVIFPVFLKKEDDEAIVKSNPLVLFIKGLILSIFLFILFFYCTGTFFPDQSRELPLVMFIYEIRLFPIAAIVLLLACLGYNISWTKHYWYWATIILLFMLVFLFYLFIDDSIGIL